MMGPMRFRIWLCLFVAGCLLRAAAPSNMAALRQAFGHPPDDARMMVRWWWFGPAVVKPELEREMRAMQQGGIGGFEVQPVYPLEVDHNFPYLSDEFLDDLKFTAEKAKEIGLRFELTLGSGWPFGGPHIPITEAAGRLRVARVEIPAGASSLPLPPVKAGEKFIAAFLDNQQLGVDGASVRLPAGASGRVLFFVSSRTRQTVKRPAVGAEGWVLDHYSRTAVDTHLSQVGEKLLAAVGKNVPETIFSDSLEVNNSDWTPDFLAQFQKRRGYDLTPYLPALAGDIGGKTKAIRHDWGLTLSELCDENYLQPITAWAHRHGTKFRSQTYGTPPVTLSSGSLVDWAEGEGTQWRRFSTSRWAASTNHLYGRAITSSETWTWLHSPVFRATPLDMKAEADIHFLQGVNQLVGHGWPYSPPEAGEPGWRFYAAAVLNYHNPWWLVMPDIAAYVQRVSFLLRQGRPDNDVALYLPTADAFAGFALGRDSVNEAIDGLIGRNVIPAILDAGYNFDFIDDGAIARIGIPQRILILPNVERIPLATMRKIAEWSRNGGTVIATRRAPSLAPGLMDAGDTPQILALAKGLRVISDESKLAEAMHAALAADLASAPEIGFIHRKLDYADIYFLANTSNHPVHTQAAFRIQGLDSAWWDPFTGKAVRAGGSKLDFDLAPYESRLVVFSKDRVPAAPAPSPAPPIDITADWKVSPPDRDKYFSGILTYEKTMTLPDLKGHQVYLNFGEGTPVADHSRRSGSGMRAMFEGPVREAAVVYVNGKRAGSVWCAPYEVNVTSLLVPGGNTIKIEVADTALNEMAKGPLPDYKALNAKYGERFQAQDMAAVVPLPYGLLGPIRLLPR
jgi:hypothetical protein